MKMTVIVMLTIGLLLSACSRADEVRDDEGRVVAFGDGMNTWTDPDTGCDYIVFVGYKSGGITPRLNADGTLYCHAQR